MTLQELQTKANAKLATFWSLLQTKQDAYFAKHGKYFQLIVSPTNAVIDGLDSDFVATSPSDEVHQIDVDFAFAEKIPFQIRVDEWVGPSGKGYKATVLVKIPDGRIFSRNRDSDNNDSGWFEVIEEEI